MSNENSDTVDKERYDEVIDSLCRLCGADNSEEVKNSGMMVINGVHFWILINPEATPDRLNVYCVYGRPPATRKDEIFQLLLEENTNLFEVSRAMFMMNPNDGSVLLATHYLLSNVVVEDLLETLESMAGDAQVWQENYYLDQSSAQESAAPVGFSPDYFA